MIQLAQIFRDGLVFQANKPIRIFGAGEGTYEVEFLGQTVKAESQNGKWLAELAPASYGVDYTLTVRHEDESVTLRDVCVGEVFLCAGQSNMQFGLGEEKTPVSTYSDDAYLRTFVSARVEPNGDFSPEDGWIAAASATLERWTAIGYLIGAHARRAGAPAVGIVNCSQGASYIQTWIDDARYVGSSLELPLDVMHMDASYPPYQHFNRPGLLYHHMLAPLFPFSFGRVIWYQGESNTSAAEAKIYVDLLNMMITNWRDSFADPTLPFTLIQIADFDQRDDDMWRGVQLAQADAPNHIPYVNTVVSADISEKDNIHPPTKAPLALRVWESIAK